MTSISSVPFFKEFSRDRRSALSGTNFRKPVISISKTSYSATLIFWYTLFSSTPTGWWKMCFSCMYIYMRGSLAMIAFSAVQSFAQTFIHNAILFIDTSNNDLYNQTHWLIGTLYLWIIAINILHGSRGGGVRKWWKSFANIPCWVACRSSQNVTPALAFKST